MENVAAFVLENRNLEIRPTAMNEAHFGCQSAQLGR
jgi:hypothetical protein